MPAFQLTSEVFSGISTVRFSHTNGSWNTLVQNIGGGPALFEMKNSLPCKGIRTGPSGFSLWYAMHFLF